MVHFLQQHAPTNDFICALKREKAVAQKQCSRKGAVILPRFNLTTSLGSVSNVRSRAKFFCIVAIGIRGKHRGLSSIESSGMAFMCDDSEEELEGIERIGRTWQQFRACSNIVLQGQ